MPIVVSKKQRIRYELAGERGPWMILHPPLFIPLKAWFEEGYVEQLQQDFRLVLIEPLGQGDSDAPSETEPYSMNSRVEHVLDVMKEVQVDFAYFLGMGLGVQVGFQMAKDHPRRIRSLITAGGHPYADIEDVASLEEKLEKLRSGNMNTYLRQWHSDIHLSEEQEELILEGETEAYALALDASTHWEGIGDDLDSLGISALMFTATSESRFLSVRDAGRRLRYGRYVILPKILQSHGLWVAEMIIPPLLEFTRRQR